MTLYPMGLRLLTRVVSSLIRISDPRVVSSLICEGRHTARSMSSTMFELKGKWFSELNESQWQGTAFSLEIKEILHHQKSEYQDILIFDRLLKTSWLAA